jgi:tRNA-Thr(GGU) m(6)t(6)A37 methyltransferase TsaA
MSHLPVSFKPIGTIRTPYRNKAPYQPVADAPGDFRLCIEPEFAPGLAALERFGYIYVLYFVHRQDGCPSLSVAPDWAPELEVGVFASRSPRRPNPIGLSVVRVRKVVDTEVYTSGLDVFDGTPLLDIKPYIQELDVKTDANYGWLEDVQDKEHLLLHIKGVPH